MDSGEALDSNYPNNNEDQDESLEENEGEDKENDGS